ncbi:MAG: hypothetical protein AMJ75_00205 [Phycisphaerae bacterium SM1_79]|nr:MAG: hypothetical protein AMJ75_00205 [Phycisphaerae bacterium SM1_79]
MPRTSAHQRYRLKPTQDCPKGQIVPGVTTIVGVLNKPALVPWANKMGLQGIDVKRYVDDKADIGVLAHAMIIGKLTNQLVDTSEYSKQQIDAAENACLSFYEWQKEHELTVLLAEQQLVSETWKFGGQFDIYGIVNKTRELLDLKTGSGIWEEHYYQLGGYAILLRENEYTFDQIRILNIPRSPDESFQQITLSGKMIDLSMEMFFDCLSIYERKKEVAKLMKRG